MAIAIYIHLPWCIARCPYCDFNAHKLGDQSDFSKYCQSIVQDLTFQVGQLNYRPEVSSIYFGGGTPSLFSPGHIETIIEIWVQI